jgi:hypothetical protein
VVDIGLRSGAFSSLGGVFFGSEASRFKDRMQVVEHPSVYTLEP